LSECLEGTHFMLFYSELLISSNMILAAEDMH